MMLPTINLKFLVPSQLTSDKAIASLTDHSMRCHYAACTATTLVHRGVYPISKARYFTRSNYRMWIWVALLSGERIGPIRLLRLVLVLLAEIADDTTQDICWESEERYVLSLAKTIGVEISYE